MATYADYTYNSKNLLKRFSHRARFKKSIAAIPKNQGVKLLDFGCGDGMFLNQLHQCLQKDDFLMGYEPYLESIAENIIPIVDDWNSALAAAPFDYITCFEVLEHFSVAMQREALLKMASALSDSGSLIISVPIEMGFPSLVKNSIRRFHCSKNDKPLYSYHNIAASFQRKPLPELRQGADYLSHVGFYFQDLEKIFVENFHILKKDFSPFPLLGRHVNSQVFYQLKKLSSCPDISR